MCLALFGCESGQVKKETTSETTASTDETAGEEAGIHSFCSDSDSGKACDGDNGCLRTVNFPFDSSALSSEAKMSSMIMLTS